MKFWLILLSVISFIEMAERRITNLIAHFEGLQMAESNPAATRDSRSDHVGRLPEEPSQSIDKPVETTPPVDRARFRNLVSQFDKKDGRIHANVDGGIEAGEENNTRSVAAKGKPQGNKAEHQLQNTPNRKFDARPRPSPRLSVPLATNRAVWAFRSPKTEQEQATHEVEVTLRPRLQRLTTVPVTTTMVHKGTPAIEQPRETEQPRAKPAVRPKPSFLRLRKVPSTDIVDKENIQAKRTQAIQRPKRTLVPLSRLTSPSFAECVVQKDNHTEHPQATPSPGVDPGKQVPGVAQVACNTRIQAKESGQLHDHHFDVSIPSAKPLGPQADTTRIGRENHQRVFMKATNRLNGTHVPVEGVTTLTTVKEVQGTKPSNPRDSPKSEHRNKSFHYGSSKASTFPVTDSVFPKSPSSNPPAFSQSRIMTDGTAQAGIQGKKRPHSEDNHQNSPQSIQRTTVLNRSPSPNSYFASSPKRTNSPREMTASARVQANYGIRKNIKDGSTLTRVNINWEHPPTPLPTGRKQLQNLISHFERELETDAAAASPRSLGRTYSQQQPPRKVITNRCSSNNLPNFLGGEKIRRTSSEDNDKVSLGFHEKDGRVRVNRQSTCTDTDTEASDSQAEIRSPGPQRGHGYGQRRGYEHGGGRGRGRGHGHARGKSPLPAVSCTKNKGNTSRYMSNTGDNDTGAKRRELLRGRRPGYYYRRGGYSFPVFSYHAENAEKARPMTNTRSTGAIAKKRERNRRKRERGKQKQKHIKSEIEKIKSEVTCSICLEVWTRPLTLPCDHVFCEDCVGGIVNHASAGARAYRGLITCPECRKEHIVPEERLRDAWPTPRQLTALVERVHSLNGK